MSIENMSLPQVQAVLDSPYTGNMNHESSQILTDVALVEFLNSCSVMKYTHPYTGNLNTIINNGSTGNSVRVRKHQLFNTVRGTTLTDDDLSMLVDSTIEVKLFDPFNIMFSVNQIDATTTVLNVLTQYVTPALRQLGESIESSILRSNYTKFFTLAGTPGEVITSDTISEASARITENAVLEVISDRVMYYKPSVLSKLVVENSKVYANNVNNIAYSQNKLTTDTSYFGFMDQSTNLLPNHLNGIWGVQDSITVDGADQNVDYITVKDSWGQTLMVKGLPISTTGAMRAGDIFTIAGIMQINQQTKELVGGLQNFTVLEDVTSDGAGLAEVKISPYMVVADANNINKAYANVNYTPADGAILTLISGDPDSLYQQSIGYDRHAITVINSYQAPSNTDHYKKSTDSNSGFTMVLTTDYHLRTLSDEYRMVVVLGHEVLNPYAGVRILGSKITY